MNLEKLKNNPLKLSWWNRFCIKRGRKNLGREEEILSSSSWHGPNECYEAGWRPPYSEYIKPKDFFNPFNKKSIDRDGKKTLWNLIMFTYPKYKSQIIDIYHSMTYYSYYLKRQKTVYSISKIRLIRKNNESIEDWIDRVSKTFKIEITKMEKANLEREEISSEKSQYYEILRQKNESF